MRTTTPSIGACFLAAGFALTASAQQPARDTPEQPIEVGLEEQVQIRLVLIDFLVVDDDGRTVPGLTIDDFKLKVDGKLSEIASLDLDCPIGAAGELSTRSDEALPPGMSDPTPRKIVLVFDYDHMTNEAEAFDRVLDLLDSWPEGPEQHMIASFGEVVRIETPFTTDRDELRWAIRRMRNDRDLFAANEGRLTELRFFDRVLSLMDILQRYEGRKTIVLMSGPLFPDGWTHDQALRELSGMATVARAAVYPVDTGGLRTPSDPAGSTFGGPTELRRLANETGGRMTSGTNDITLAYAKAQRDMRCTYTLGVYDRSGKLDNKRRLTLKVKKRRDLRVIYPQFFIRQSDEERKTSLLRTAGLAPQMFESEGIRTEHFVVGAPAMNRWTTRFALEIALDPTDLRAEVRSWNLTGFVRRLNGTVVEKFERSLVVPAHDPDRPAIPVATLYHDLELAPGEYAFSAVVSSPDELSPRTATHLVKLVQPPPEGLFVIGPILGQRTRDASKGAVVFRPLLDSRATRGQPLESMTVLCVAGETNRAREATIERSIATLDGDVVHSYEQVPVSLPAGKRVGCAEVIDPVSTNGLAPGLYELLATARTGDVRTRRQRSPFTIQAPGAELGEP